MVYKMTFLKKILAVLKTANISDYRKRNACDSAQNCDVDLSEFQGVSFERMRCEGNNYYITRKVPYQTDRFFKTETVETVFDFAYKMTFGREGAHRDHRSGGSHTRRNGEIFANTFQGKLAECAVSNLFYQLGCLSLLGDPRKCKRYKTIKVQYQTLEMKMHTKTYTGWTAQIIQHEVDHCNGILI